MVEDWGLPRSLYLDNGSEYKWDEMIAGFSAITAAVDVFNTFINEQKLTEFRREIELNIQQKPLTRAKPYNAPAKQIEGVFGILERGFFSMIPGWIGGDRMNKRTHKLGAQPNSFTGSETEFKGALTQAIDFYRNTPQKNTTSPNQKRAAFNAQGWKPYIAPREVFLFAFSELVKIKVRTNGIEKDGEWYYSDALIPYIGQTIEIRFAKWDRSCLFLIDATGKPIAIPKTQTYGQLDQAGAIEQSRRSALMNNHLRLLKNDTNRLDLLDEVRQFNTRMPAPPVLPDGISIGLGAESQALTDALINAPAATLEPLLMGSALRHSSGAILRAQAPPEDVAPKSNFIISIKTTSCNNNEKEEETPCKPLKISAA
jgi:hypothetical protein